MLRRSWPVAKGTPSRNWQSFAVPPEGVEDGASTLIDVAVDSDDSLYFVYATGAGLYCRQLYFIMRDGRTGLWSNPVRITTRDMPPRIPDTEPGGGFCRIVVLEGDGRVGEREVHIVYLAWGWGKANIGEASHLVHVYDIGYEIPGRGRVGDGGRAVSWQYIAEAEGEYEYDAPWGHVLLPQLVIPPGQDSDAKLEVVWHMHRYGDPYDHFGHRVYMTRLLKAGNRWERFDPEAMPYQHVSRLYSEEEDFVRMNLFGSVTYDSEGIPWAAIQTTINESSLEVGTFQYDSARDLVPSPVRLRCYVRYRTPEGVEGARLKATLSLEGRFRPNDRIPLEPAPEGSGGGRGWELLETREPVVVTDLEMVRTTRVRMQVEIEEKYAYRRDTAPEFEVDCCWIRFLDEAGRELPERFPTTVAAQGPWIKEKNKIFRGDGQPVLLPVRETPCSYVSVLSWNSSLEIWQEDHRTDLKTGEATYHVRPRLRVLPDADHGGDRFHLIFIDNGPPVGMGERPRSEMLHVQRIQGAWEPAETIPGTEGVSGTGAQGVFGNDYTLAARPLEGSDSGGELHLAFTAHDTNEEELRWRNRYAKYTRFTHTSAGARWEEDPQVVDHGSKRDGDREGPFEFTQAMVSLGPEGAPRIALARAWHWLEDGSRERSEGYEWRCRLALAPPGPESG
jgi:hypothetical protein